MCARVPVFSLTSVAPGVAHVRPACCGLDTVWQHRPVSGFGLFRVWPDLTCRFNPPSGLTIVKLILRGDEATV